MQAFSGYVEQQLLSSRSTWASDRGGFFSSLLLLQSMGSRLVGFSSYTDFVASQHVESSGTMDPSPIPHIGRQIPTPGPPEKSKIKHFNLPF